MDEKQLNQYKLGQHFTNCRTKEDYVPLEKYFPSNEIENIEHIDDETPSYILGYN